MAAYWEIAAHSAYDMFSKYKYIIINFVFSHLDFWSWNFFLAPFTDHFLLLLFHFGNSQDCPIRQHQKEVCSRVLSMQDKKSAVNN